MRLKPRCSPGPSWDALVCWLPMRIEITGNGEIGTGCHDGLWDSCEHRTSANPEVFANAETRIKSRKMVFATFDADGFPRNWLNEGVFAKERRSSDTSRISARCHNKNTSKED